MATKNGVNLWLNKFIVEADMKWGLRSVNLLMSHQHHFLAYLPIEAPTERSSPSDIMTQANRALKSQESRPYCLIA